MQSLETFLKDRKHTLKVIEEVNDQIKSGEISLEGVVHNIKQNFDCDSSWAIYLCSCKQCGGQYVGKSKTPFKLIQIPNRKSITRLVVLATTMGVVVAVAVRTFL